MTRNPLTPEPRMFRISSADAMKCLFLDIKEVKISSAVLPDDNSPNRYDGFSVDRDKSLLAARLTYAIENI